MSESKNLKKRNLSLEEMFVHIAYEYRCLANAAYAWEFVNNQDNKGEKNKIDQLIPEASTIIQDSLLLHARTLIEFLIEFYLPNNTRETDIHISHFTEEKLITEEKLKELKQIKKQIEVHLLHLTKWRDTQYRENGDEEVQRPNWNKKNKKIFKLLIESLKEVAENLSNPWKEAFKKLEEAAERRSNKGSSYNWPKELGEKKGISDYIKSLND